MRNAIKMLMRKRNAVIYLLGLEVFYYLRPNCIYASKCSDQTAQARLSVTIHIFFHKLAHLISQY